MDLNLYLNESFVILETRASIESASNAQTWKWSRFCVAWRHDVY